MDDHTQLAVLLGDTPPECFRVLVPRAIDDAVNEASRALDELIDEITAYKRRLADEAATIKHVLDAHFALGAEAMAFASAVRKRLDQGVPAS